MQFRLLREGSAIFKYFSTSKLCINGLKNQCLVALHARANLRARAASGTVKGRNSNGEFQARQTIQVFGLCLCRCICQLFRGHHQRANNRMRANIRAEVTLNAVVGVPLRNINRNTALFISSTALRYGTICIILKVSNCQLAAAERIYGVKNILYIANQLRAVTLNFLLVVCVRCILPALRHFHFVEAIHTAVNRSMVHSNNLVTLLAVRLGCSSLHEFNSLLNWNNVRDFKERSLQNGVNAAAEAKLFTNLNTVNGVEVNIILCDISLHFAG